MGSFLILLLVLQLFYTTTFSRILNTPLYTANSINDKLSDYSLLLPPELANENDEFIDDEDAWDSVTDVNDDDTPMVQSFEDKTELKFRLPIESVNVDYSRNAIVLKFHKSNGKYAKKLDSVENEKKKSLQDNFIRFGKKSYEEFPLSNNLDASFIDKNLGMRLKRSQPNARDSRGDNFIRFGRSANVKNDFMRFGRQSNDFMRFGRMPSQDFMRFGRTPNQDFMRFGRTTDQDFMRFGRSPGQDFMRFGRTPTQDFMRFGRAPGQDFMRFGRAPGQDFMRFGRNPSQDFMRFGRAAGQDFMRFGRNHQDNFMRLGRSSPKAPMNTNFMRYSRPDNFMRFGRNPPNQASNNFMRFGKSLDKSNDKNNSQPLLDKNELKQAVKLIHEADKNAENENPVDRAIKVLFDKHQQQDSNDKALSDGLSYNSENQHNDNNQLDSAGADYLLENV